MRRVIVLGGRGIFGGTAAALFRAQGIRVMTASRRPGADICVDADDPASIKSALRPDDLILDAAGPFQTRSTALVQAAIDSRFDIIDLNDSLAYAQRILALQPRIDAAGIRILIVASTISAASAAILRHSGMQSPYSITTFLAPATKYTANSGTAQSLVESVGRPVQFWRDGTLQTAPGWSQPRRFPVPPPVDLLSARLFESADALLLPRIWPSLRHVAMYVDTHTVGLNALLRLAAAWPAIRSMLAAQSRLGTWAARMLGSASGGLSYEITAKHRGTLKIVRYAIVAASGSHRTAVAPALLASLQILEDRFPFRGLAPPDKHVEPTELLSFLNTHRINLIELA